MIVIEVGMDVWVYSHAVNFDINDVMGFITDPEPLTL